MFGWNRIEYVQNGTHAHEDTRMGHTAATKWSLRRAAAVVSWPSHYDILLKDDAIYPDTQQQTEQH